MISEIATLHGEIFQAQHKYLRENTEYLSHLLTKQKLGVNKLLSKRNSSKRQKSLLTTFEEIFLQTLDENNQLTGEIRLNLFFLLLHAAHKTEEKLLCIHVLRNQTPRDSHEKLVQSGFFRILNLWIQQCLIQDFDADDSSGIPMLTIICHLLRECYYLDIDIAKKFDILRLIKKIGKVSSSVNSTEELQQAVAALKSSWQEEVNKEDSAVRAALIKSKLKNEKANQGTSNTSSVETETSETAKQDNVEKQAMEVVDVDAINPPIQSKSGAEPQSSPSTSENPSPPSSSIAPAPVKMTVVPARTSHQPLNVVGKLGATQIQDLIHLTAPRQPKPPRTLPDKNIGITRDESTLEILQQAMLPKIVLVKSSEVKGIMKKSKVSDETEEKPKPSGRLISWNEKLFDIRYFEVEPTNNMTKSTSRLRQEVHQKKIMTTQCEWKRPEKREILAEDKVDVHSFEESIQRKRLLSILQRFYPDDDDIPSDPEDDPNVEEDGIRKSLSDCTMIPWDNDEVPSTTSVVPTPALTSILKSVDQSGFMAEEKEREPPPYPFQHHLLNSTPYGSPDRIKPISTVPSYSSSLPSSLSPDRISSSRSIYEPHIGPPPKSDQICHYFNQRQGCRRGAACLFIHENLHDKKRSSEPSFDYPHPKRNRSRSPSPPPRFGRTRSPSPPLRYGRTVSREPAYFEPVPLRKTREQMKLSSTIYGADRAPSPPSPPPLKNPSASRKLANTVCSAYISGSCRYGYKCHYLHEQMDMFGDLEDEEEDELPVPTISPNSWNKTIDRDNTVLVRMKGLPADVSYQDLLEFFNGTVAILLRLLPPFS
jgi:hypothetical protein